MAERIVIRGDNITLDLLLWRRFGQIGHSLVEAAHSLNPGLAALGPVLPFGTSVALPDLPRASTYREQPVSLFE